MDASQIYILISAFVFLAIAVIFFLLVKKKPKQLSRLAAVAFAFVILGGFFSENRWVGYTLMGVGVAIAIIDIVVNKAKKK